MNISEQLIVRSLENKTMIINLNNGKVTVIDEIGTIFWDALCNSITQEELFQKMQAQFDVSFETLKKDYDKFVEKLRVEEIIW